MSVHLFVGGSRSGKSDQAQRTGEALPGPRVFVATCPLLDEEMRQRVKLHQEARSERHWETLEEPLDLVGALERSRSAGVVLIDCLTLWINNLLFQVSETLSEAAVARQAEDLMGAARQVRGTVLLVSSEVGAGIVPADALSRRYRDLLGRCNQVVAREADQVTLMTCGIPLIIKRQETLITSG